MLCGGVSCSECCLLGSVCYGCHLKEGVRIAFYKDNISVCSLVRGMFDKLIILGSKLACFLLIMF